MHRDAFSGSPLRRFLPPLFCALCAFAVFLPALHNGFVNWDDEANFLFNPHYRGLAAANLQWMFSTFHMGHYMPLTWLSCGLDYALWGMNPAGYHFTSLLLHSVACALFYFVALELLRLALPGTPQADLRAGAVFAALCFGIHPLRTESVAWVTARRDVLSAVFAFPALWFYLRGARAGAAAMNRPALAFFALALLSRENTAGLAPALLILDVYPLRRLPASPLLWARPEYRRVLAEKIPYVLLGACAVLLAGAATLHSLPPEGLVPVPFSRRLALLVYGLKFYVEKTLLPYGLAPLYELGPELGLLHGAGLSALAFSLALGGLAFLLRRRAPGFSAVCAFYLLFTLPILGITHTLSAVYDRYSYYSCLGFAVLAGWACVKLLEWGGGLRAKKALALALLCAVAGNWAALSALQARVWRDSVSLWAHTVAVADGPNESARLNLGRALLLSGNLDGALAQCDAVIALNPRAFDAYLNRAAVWRQAGAARPAYDDFDKAYALDPSCLQALLGRALSGLELGYARQSLRDFDYLVGSGFMLPLVLSGRARACVALGMEKQAREDCARAVGLDPAVPCPAPADTEGAKAHTAWK